MNQHPLFQVITITIIATALLHIPIWAIALGKKTVKPIDFACPFMPIVFWAILIKSGIGSQSTSYLFEIPIIILATVTGCILLLFLPLPSLRSKKGRSIIISSLMLLVLILRLFMPEINNLSYP